MGNLERSSANQVEGSSNALEQGKTENQGEREPKTSNWEDVDPARIPDRRNYVPDSEPLDDRERAELASGPESTTTNDPEGPTARDILHTDNTNETPASDPADPPDDAAAYLPHPSTEIYRTDGNQRLERPDFRDEPNLVAPPDESRRSKVEMLLSNPDNIDNLRDSAEYNVDLAERIFDRSTPTGAHTLATKEHPVAYETPREGIHGGELAVASLALWALLTRFASSARNAVNWLNEMRGGNENDRK